VILRLKPLYLESLMLALLELLPERNVVRNPVRGLNVLNTWDMILAGVAFLTQTPS